jgi:hypothetical protein
VASRQTKPFAMTVTVCLSYSRTSTVRDFGSAKRWRIASPLLWDRRGLLGGAPDALRFGVAAREMAWDLRKIAPLHSGM